MTLEGKVRKPQPGEIARVATRDPRHNKDVIKAFIRSDTVAHLTGTVEPGDRALVLDSMQEGEQVYFKVLTKGGTWWLHSAFLESESLD